jgi:hypothetical protein
MKIHASYLLSVLFITLCNGCVSYPTLLTSTDYDGNKILVQRHADPCCAWAGLRFVYKEGKQKEHVIYYYWFDVPYVQKEVRTLDHNKVIRSDTFQLVFDTSKYRESLFVERGFGDTSKYDINDGLLATKNTKPTISLNHIDSILLFHAPHLLTNVDYNQRRIWLLEKAAGYIQGKRKFSYNYNWMKAIK